MSLSQKKPLNMDLDLNFFFCERKLDNYAKGSWPIKIKLCDLLVIHESWVSLDRNFLCWCRVEFRYVCIWICDYGWVDLCIVLNHFINSNSVRMCNVCGYFVSGEGEGSNVSAPECLTLLELHWAPSLAFRSCTISWPLTSHQPMNPSAQRTCLHILWPAFCVWLFRTR